MHVDLVFAEPVTADPTGRRIRGTALPYGVASGPTANGNRYRFFGPPTNAADLVDVVREHDEDAVVGRLSAWEPGDDRLAAAVRLFTTTAGNDALVEASEQVRTGFSVGADAHDPTLADDGVYDVHEWDARHIGLVRRPAFTDATITSVAASAAPDHDDEDDVEDSDPDVPDQDDDQEDDMTTTTTPPVELSRPSRRRADLTFARVRDTLAAAIRRSPDAAFVNAALLDIVPAGDAGEAFLRPQWLDELWTPVSARRDYIESINRQALGTGTKVYGWKWNQLPVVGDYAGNKTPIPSNAVDTEPAEAPVTRLAGGWDVDRIFVDLGDPGFLEALFRAATVDVGRKQEAKVSAALQAEATDAAAANILEALNVIATTLSGVGASVSFIGVAPDLWGDFLSLTGNDAPWWLSNQGSVALGTSEGEAGGLRFFADPTLPAGHVLGGDRQAATYFEAAPNPLRVQAVNIPNGGIDIAVFAYQAVIVNDPRGIVDVTVATTPLAATSSKSSK